MKVILTVGGLFPEHGGPSRSIPALAESLAQTGTEVELLTCQAARNLNAPLLADASLVTNRVLPYSCRTWPRGFVANGFAGAVVTACRGAIDCVIQDNGLWLPTNHEVAIAARQMKTPFMISPRGMLSGWALDFKKWKKRVAWWLYQGRDIQSAQVLHATSRAEADDFRAAGLKQPIAVIPNGVNVPEGLERRRVNSGPKTVLFLSRIHPKKGLLALVEAWRRVKPKGWQAVIAGGDEAGHRAEVEKAIRDCQLEKEFSLIGPVEGKARWKLYQEADLFVLPSFSENFGIVVAEALACGVPAVATRGTPWEDLATHRCGWWPAVGPAELAEALRDAFSRSDDERRQMGERGRELVGTKYAWPNVAKQMVAVYRWMLGTAPKPDCVVE